MSDKNPEAVIGTAERPSFGSRLKTHFKRWWWVHVIIFCACVLIIALPLVYVGYPNIAQGDINDSTLSVSSMVISNPKPDGFQLDQTQVIGTKSIFHPDIYSFEAEVGLDGDDNPFATATVPSSHAKDGVEVRIQQWLDLTNTTAFGAFSTAIMLNEEVGLAVRGKPGLKLGALPKINVNYDKVVTMKGLNKLAGFKLVEMRLDGHRTDGNNANGTVFIPNPSVITINMGNVTMDLSSNGTYLGQAFLNNLVLKPGGGNFPMVSKVDKLAIVGLLPPKAPFTVAVDIKGNSSMYNGEELPYFSAALAANTLTISLDIAKVIG